jgi:thiol-disulfide isomerase/thioredoxin
MNSTFAVSGFRFKDAEQIGAFSRTAAVMLVLSAFARGAGGAEPQAELRKAPELASIASWSNSDPITLADQKGKIVMLHFWAFSCINCQRNLPHYNQWRKDFAEDKVQIIGVHTPETADEADVSNVAVQVKKRGIKYPVAVDSDAATWKAYENRYWPTVYLIDQQGRVRYRWEGELEYKKAGGDRIVRQKIKDLLAEEKP